MNVLEATKSYTLSQNITKCMSWDLHRSETYMNCVQFLILLGIEPDASAFNASKAFDSIKQEHIWVCQLLILDAKPQVSVQMATFTPLLLQRGRNRGCPLSLLLFTVAIEPLACLLQQTTGVIGFHSPEGKLALHVSDALLFCLIYNPIP